MAVVLAYCWPVVYFWKCIVPCHHCHAVNTAQVSIFRIGQYTVGTYWHSSCMLAFGYFSTSSCPLDAKTCRVSMRWLNCSPKTLTPPEHWYSLNICSIIHYSYV